MGYYSSHISRANADVLGFGPGDDSFGDDIGSDDGWEDSRNEELNNEYSNKQAEKDTENNEISSGEDYYPADNETSSGIKIVNFNTEFTYSPENIYSTRWGFKYSHEVYEMTAFGDNIRKQNETINQYSPHIRQRFYACRSTFRSIQSCKFPKLLQHSTSIRIEFHTREKQSDISEFFQDGAVLPLYQFQWFRSAYRLQNESDKDLGFRQTRGEFNYRMYNLLGNPPEEDIVDFYSVHLSENCLPYGSISFKF